MTVAIACLGRVLQGYESEQDLYFRVKKAVALFKDKPSAYVILSGGYTSSKEFSEASVMKRFATDMGIPEEKIILEEKATNTVENAIYINEIVGKHNFRELYIVTSPYHLMRTRIIFNKVIAGKKLMFVASQYPFTVPNLLAHYISESVRMLRIMIFGLKIKKK